MLNLRKKIMKKLGLLLLLPFCFLINSTQALAWGEKGHTIVAEVAFHYMDASTKANVKSLLQGMTLAEAANWMDAKRSDRAYDYMKPFHYIDIEKGGKEMPTGENIVTTLQKTLKDLDGMKTLSKEEVKIRILYLMHLIGDVHQPMHIGYPDDKGGNTAQVSFLGKGSNLHAVWDTDIIEYKGISTADVLKTNKYTPEQLAAIKQIDVITWAAQSRSHLKNAYTIPDGKINDQYVDENAPTVKTQLLNAGIRLAAVLDHYFKDTATK
jgi:hypothetical protein